MAQEVARVAGSILGVSKDMKGLERFCMEE